MYELKSTITILRHPIWDKRNDKSLKETYEQIFRIFSLLKKHFKNIDIIFSSPTKRCLFLAKAISIKFNAKIIKTSLLKERNEGIYKFFGEKTEKFLEFKSKNLHYCEYKPFLGESVISVLKRTKKFIEKYLKNLKYKNVVIVTHYTNILCFYAIFTKKDIKYVWDYEDFLEKGSIGFLIEKSKIKKFLFV
ncbi:MAG: histidine phosphatase family protein [Candidatus Aenigmatarchaeota archaeon]